MMRFRRISARSMTLGPLIWMITGLCALTIFTCDAADGQNNRLPPFQHTPAWNATWTDRLKRDLLFKYDKFARPTPHFNTTVVKYDLSLSELTISLNDFKSSIIVQTWMHMIWTDDKLKWNASRYGGLRHLQVGNHEIWQPDILLYNSVAGSSVEYYGDTHCLIQADGSVLWSPPTQFQALCDLDFRLWPFDTQNCELRLGSWMFHGDEIDLEFMSPDDIFDPADHHQYTEWRLIAMTKNRELTIIDDLNFISLIYKLTIKRQSPLYYVTVVAPAATIVFLVLVIFWLPPQCSEKITLCSCTALIISIFLIHFSHKVPPLLTKPPLLICFYSGCLYIVTISLIISAFVINLSRRPYCKPLPRGIKNFLIGRAGRYLVLFDHIQLLDSRGPIVEQELQDSHQNVENNYHRSNSSSLRDSDGGDREKIITPTMNTAQLEWILAATAIDRLAFCLFAVIFAIMAVVCLL